MTGRWQPKAPALSKKTLQPAAQTLNSFTYNRRHFLLLGDFPKLFRVFSFCFRSPPCLGATVGFHTQLSSLVLASAGALLHCPTRREFFASSIVVCLHLQVKLVCKLHKSLYGLKQSLRKWNAKVTNVLLEFDFSQSKADYSLFTKLETNGDFVAFLVYVDDIIIASSSTQLSNKVKKFWNAQFKLKDLGQLKYFLGLEVARTDKGFNLSKEIYY
ncbi:Reverse transcriptase [Theobroma cacao]|nr:Reverse transcriptase [Theobroma cacao]